MNPFDPARDYADSNPHTADGADYRPTWPNMASENLADFAANATGEQDNVNITPADERGTPPSRFTYPYQRGEGGERGTPPSRFTYPYQRGEGGRLADD